MSAADPVFRPNVLTVYGLDWCEDTTRARRHFYTAELGYRYVRLEDDDTARAALRGAGHVATPVVVMPSGLVFVEPTDEQLDAIVDRALGT